MTLDQSMYALALVALIGRALQGRETPSAFSLNRGPGLRLSLEVLARTSDGATAQRKRSSDVQEDRE